MSQFLKEEGIDSSILKTRWSGHVSQMRLRVLKSAYEQVKDDFLVDLIHRFWTLKGLLDFKILGSKSAGEILLIWSYQTKEQYDQMLNSEVWKTFQSELSLLALRQRLQIINSIANTYEVIE